MKFDDVLVELGEFGFYQKRLYLILCIPAISVGCYMMINVFNMHAPDHRFDDLKFIIDIILLSTLGFFPMSYQYRRFLARHCLISHNFFFY